MINQVNVPYRVFLPDWVFITAENEEEVEKNAKLYLKKNYPERYFLRVEGEYALCEMK